MDRNAVPSGVVADLGVSGTTSIHSAAQIVAPNGLALDQTSVKMHLSFRNLQHAASIYSHSYTSSYRIRGDIRLS